MRTHKSASSIDLQQLEAASFFAIENQMNCIAEECNLTPIEIRILNLNSQQNSKKDKNQFILNTENASEMFNFITSQSDFNRKHASFKFGSKQYSMQADKKETSLYSTHLRGIGISYAWEGSGYFGSVINDNSQTLEVLMENDSSITIHCPPVSPIIQDVWTKTVFNILGLNPSQIKFDTNYKTYQEPQMPESIYSNISIMTSLLTKCCEFLKKNKGTKKFPLTVKRQISANKKKEWDNEAFTGNPFHGLGTCCATVELEINPFTLKEEIKQIVLFIDGGKMLNPQDSEMTIKLEIENILSALVQNENCICDNIKINFLQSNKEPTQIGELVYQVIPAAFTQALSQALGKKISTIPLNAETIYENLFNTNESGVVK